MAREQAIYFDFDGVLTLDTNGSTTTFTKLHELHGLPMPFDEFYKGYSDEEGKARFMHPLEKGQVTHKDVWKELCNKMGAQMNYNHLNEAFRSTQQHPESFELARKMHDAGYTVGMITDNPADRMQALDAYWGLSKLFNPMVVSADPDVGTLKKDERARAFAVAQARSGVPLENSVFIDNSSGNVESSIRHGLPAILLDDSTLKDPLKRAEEIRRIESLLRSDYGFSF